MLRGKGDLCLERRRFGLWLEQALVFDDAVRDFGEAEVALACGFLESTEGVLFGAGRARSSRRG